ncbi:MAG: hypothetical protein L6R00_04880 [Phycisphaerae bacterium]|nr:hypothetical protein [Phycisphaerae bacterium]
MKAQSSMPILVAAFCVVGTLFVQAGAEAQQPYRRNDPRRDRERKVDRGHISGRIIAVAPLDVGGAQRKTRVKSSDKSAGSEGPSRWMITVQPSKGRQISVTADGSSEIRIMRTELAGAGAMRFVQAGVEVEVEWSEITDPQTGGNAGLRADRMSVRAEEIEGTVDSIDKRRIVAKATPKVDKAPEGLEQPKVQVQGRGDARKGRSRRSANAGAVKPLTVRMAPVDGATRYTLDGTESTAADVLAAWKRKKALEFEAVVVSGGGNPVVEFHARSETTKKDGNFEGGAASKKSGR